MPQKILVVRFSSIGDVVLCSPIIRCLAQQLADSEIHFITKKKFAPLLESNPYLKRIHAFDKEVTECFRELSNIEFDVVIDLHKNLRSIRLKKHLGVTSYTFPKLNIEKWVIVNFKFDLLPKVHLVDRYFEAVKGLGIKNDQKGLDFFVPESTTLNLANHGLSEKQEFIAYAFGGNHKGKLLPTEKAISLLDKLKLPVILLGGKEDKERGDEIAQAVKSNWIINLAGKLSLFESALALKESKVVLAHDTGLMHIASAFKKPIVSLWGGTTPVFGMYPYLAGADSKTVVSKNKLNPSSKLGKPTLFNPEPMKNINLNEIIEAVEIAS